MSEHSDTKEYVYVDIKSGVSSDSGEIIEITSPFGCGSGYNDWMRENETHDSKQEDGYELSDFFFGELEKSMGNELIMHMDQLKDWDDIHDVFSLSKDTNSSESESLNVLHKAALNVWLINNAEIPSGDAILYTEMMMTSGIDSVSRLSKLLLISSKYLLLNMPAITPEHNDRILRALQYDVRDKPPPLPLPPLSDTFSFALSREKQTNKEMDGTNTNRRDNSNQTNCNELNTPVIPVIPISIPVIPISIPVMSSNPAIESHQVTAQAIQRQLKVLIEQFPSHVIAAIRKDSGGTSLAYEPGVVPLQPPPFAPPPPSSSPSEVIPSAVPEQEVHVQISNLATYVSDLITNVLSSNGTGSKLSIQDFEVKMLPLFDACHGLAICSLVEEIISLELQYHEMAIAVDRPIQVTCEVLVHCYRILCLLTRPIDGNQAFQYFPNIRQLVTRGSTIASSLNRTFALGNVHYSPTRQQPVSTAVVSAVNSVSTSSSSNFNNLVGQLIVYSLKLFRNLCNSKSKRLFFGLCGVGESVAKWFLKKEYGKTIVRWSLAAVSAYCTGEDNFNREKIIHVNAVESALLLTSKYLADAEVVVEGLACLRNVLMIGSKGGEGNAGGLVVHVGGRGDASDVLTTSIQNELDNFLSTVELAQEVYLRLSGLQFADLLVNCLAQHCSNVTVVMNACRCVSTICDEISPLASHSLASAGICETIMYALTKHASDSAVVVQCLKATFYLCVNCAVAREKCMQSGCYEALDMVFVAHCKSPLVVMWACKSLHCLALNDVYVNESTLQDESSASSNVESQRYESTRAIYVQLCTSIGSSFQHFSKDNILEGACTSEVGDMVDAVSSLALVMSLLSSFNARFRVQFSTTNTIASLASALKLYSLYEDTTFRICCAVHFLACDSEIRLMIGSLGLCEVLDSLLLGGGVEGSVACSALMTQAIARCIGTLARSCEGNISVFKQLHTSEKILDSLRMYSIMSSPAIEIAIEYCIRALHFLCEGDVDIAISVAKSESAIKLLISTCVSNFIAAEGVCKYCCLLLRTLVEANAELGRDQILQCGGVGLLTQILVQHKSRDTVVHGVVRVFGLILVDEKLSMAFRPQLHLLFHAVLTCLSLHVDYEPICVESLQIVHVLITGDSDIIEVIVREGLIANVIRAMGLHRNSRKVVYIAVAVFSAILENSNLFDAITGKDQSLMEAHSNATRADIRPSLFEFSLEDVASIKRTLSSLLSCQVIASTLRRCRGSEGVGRVCLTLIAMVCRAQRLHAGGLDACGTGEAGDVHSCPMHGAKAHDAVRHVLTKTNSQDEGMGLALCDALQALWLSHPQVMVFFSCASVSHALCKMLTRYKHCAAVLVKVCQLVINLARFDPSHITTMSGSQKSNVGLQDSPTRWEIANHVDKNDVAGGGISTNTGSVGVGGLDLSRDGEKGIKPHHHHQQQQQQQQEEQPLVVPDSKTKFDLLKDPYINRYHFIVAGVVISAVTLLETYSAVGDSCNTAYAKEADTDVSTADTHKSSSLQVSPKALSLSERSALCSEVCDMLRVVLIDTSSTVNLGGTVAIGAKFREGSCQSLAECFKLWTDACEGRVQQLIIDQSIDNGKWWSDAELVSYCNVQVSLCQVIAEVGEPVGNALCLTECGVCELLYRNLKMIVDINKYVDGSDSKEYLTQTSQHVVWACMAMRSMTHHSKEAKEQFNVVQESYRDFIANGVSVSELAPATACNQTIQTCADVDQANGPSPDLASLLTTALVWYLPLQESDTCLFIVLCLRSFCENNKQAKVRCTQLSTMDCLIKALPSLLKDAWDDGDKDETRKTTTLSKINSSIARTSELHVHTVLESKFASSVLWLLSYVPPSDTSLLLSDLLCKFCVQCIELNSIREGEGEGGRKKHGTDEGNINPTGNPANGVNSLQSVLSGTFHTSDGDGSHTYRRSTLISALSAICNLCNTHHQNKVTISVFDICEVLTGLMTTSLHDDVAMEHICMALSQVSEDCVFNQKRVNVTLVLKICQSFYDSANVIASTYGCITSLCKGYVQNLEKVMTVPSIKIILKGMYVHPSSEVVARRGCSLIAFLASCNPEFQNLFATNGACNILLDCMTYHHTSANVQREACWAICSMCQQNIANRKKFGAEGAASVITSTLIAFKDMQAVILWACGAMANVASGSAENAMKFDESGLTEHLVGIVREYGIKEKDADTEGILKYGVWGLGSIGVVPEVAMKICQLGGVSVVLTIFRKHMETEAVCQLACTAVKNLSGGGLDCVDMLEKAKAMDMLQEAIALHQDHENTLKWLKKAQGGYGANVEEVLRRKRDKERDGVVEAGGDVRGNSTSVPASISSTSATATAPAPSNSKPQASTALGLLNSGNSFLQEAAAAVTAAAQQAQAKAQQVSGGSKEKSSSNLFRRNNDSK